MTKRKEECKHKYFTCLDCSLVLNRSEIEQLKAEEIFSHKCKYLVFEEITENTVVIKNKKLDTLGVIKFDNTWDKYVFETDNLRFDFDCLLAIVGKLKQKHMRGKKK